VTAITAHQQVEHEPSDYYTVFVGEDNAPGWDGCTYAGLWCCHRHETLTEAAACYEAVGRDHTPPVMAVTSSGVKRNLTRKELAEIKRALRMGDSRSA
jgi:hypothetical protein